MKFVAWVLNLFLPGADHPLVGDIWTLRSPSFTPPTGMNYYIVGVGTFYVDNIFLGTIRRQNVWWFRYCYKLKQRDISSDTQLFEAVAKRELTPEQSAAIMLGRK